MFVQRLPIFILDQSPRLLSRLPHLLVGLTRSALKCSLLPFSGPFNEYCPKSKRKLEVETKWVASGGAHAT